MSLLSDGWVCGAVLDGLELPNPTALLIMYQPEANRIRRNEFYDCLVVGSCRRVRSVGLLDYCANVYNHRLWNECDHYTNRAASWRRPRRRNHVPIVCGLVLFVLMGLAGCSRQARLHPEKIYATARGQFERGELVQALTGADAGFKRFEKTQPEWAWRFQVLKAEVLVWQGKSKESLQLLQNLPPDSVQHDPLVIRRKIIQSVDYYYLQQFSNAESCLSEAEQVARDFHPEMLGEVASVKGRFATARGDYSTGEALFLQARKSAGSQHEEFLESVALGNLGWNAMLQQHYDQAIDWFAAALSIARRIGNEGLAVRTFGNLGWCYYKLGDYDQSASMYEESQKLAEKLGLLNDQQLRLNNIGLIRYQQGDYLGAEQSYKEALEITRKLDNKLASAMVLDNLASVALETTQYDLADRYSREAVLLLSSIDDKTTQLESTLIQARIALGREQYPRAMRLFGDVTHGSGSDLSLRWEAESYLAALYAAEGKDARADLQYKKGLQTIDKARAALTKDEYRLSFLNTATQFYNDYIDFLVAHHREREALAVAEHSRARTLAEGLKLPVAQVGEAFHPEQNARKTNSVVLSYWLKPGHSYLWAVTPSKVQLFVLPSRDEIDALVGEYRKGLLGPRGLRDPADAEKLYNMLIAPAGKLIQAAGKEPNLMKAADAGHGTTVPRVIVIADGSLLSLNFETLMVPTPEPHYWIEDAIVSNAASIALLRAENRAIVSSGHRAAEKNGSTARSSNGSILLIGNPNYAGTDFPQLTQAKLEIQKVESYFPPPERTVIEDTAAVPAAYDQAKPGQFSYIHFVAHGTASRVSPLDSGIVLSKQGDTYKLYARDIMQQPLKADLVTVSACYGAGNRAYSGEGLVGLSWAFLRAGAHNVIAALWEVNDASTPQLMDNLYRNINNGEDPAFALRHAKLDLLHSDNVYSRPFYWGAFQLYVGS